MIQAYDHAYNRTMKLAGLHRKKQAIWGGLKKLFSRGADDAASAAGSAAGKFDDLPARQQQWADDFTKLDDWGEQQRFVGNLYKRQDPDAALEFAKRMRSDVSWDELIKRIDRVSAHRSSRPRPSPTPTPNPKRPNASDDPWGNKARIVERNKQNAPRRRQNKLNVGRYRSRRKLDKSQEAIEEATRQRQRRRAVGSMTDEDYARMNRQTMQWSDPVTRSQAEQEWTNRYIKNWNKARGPQAPTSEALPGLMSSQSRKQNYQNALQQRQQAFRQLDQ